MTWRNANTLVLLIGKAFHLHYFLWELGMGGSIGKTLGSLLILEVAALQVCSLETISSASPGIWPLRALNRAFAGSESSTNWAVSWWSRANRSSSFALIAAKEIPTAWEELSSSPSSSEISMAKENKLFGESCSWRRNEISYLVIKC